MKIRRLILPTIVCGVALYLLVGCIYIPTFNLTVTGKNVNGEVGEQDSDKEIRKGVTSREEVVRALGPPQRQSPDGRKVAYLWTAREGVWVWPLCFFGTNSRDNHQALILTYDDGGLLQAYELSSLEVGGAFDFYHNDGIEPPLPPELQRFDLHPDTEPATTQSVDQTMPSDAASRPATTPCE